MSVHIIFMLASGLIPTVAQDVSVDRVVQLKAEVWYLAHDSMAPADSVESDAGPGRILAGWKEATVAALPLGASTVKLRFGEFESVPVPLANAGKPTYGNSLAEVELEVSPNGVVVLNGGSVPLIVLTLDGRSPGERDAFVLLILPGSRSRVNLTGGRDGLIFSPADLSALRLGAMSVESGGDVDPRTRQGWRLNTGPVRLRSVSPYFTALFTGELDINTPGRLQGRNPLMAGESLHLETVKYSAFGAGAMVDLELFRLTAAFYKDRVSLRATEPLGMAMSVGGRSTIATGRIQWPAFVFETRAMRFDFGPEAGVLWIQQEFEGSIFDVDEEETLNAALAGLSARVDFMFDPVRVSISASADVPFGDLGEGFFGELSLGVGIGF